MITKLDHVAIAVPDIAAAVERFRDHLGLHLQAQEDVEQFQTSTAFFPVSGTRIELVHPMDGKGPIARYLDRKGGGLHHICFETDDIESDMELLKARGYRFLSDGPSPGAHGARVAFLHPKDTDGVLIELAEHPRP